MPKPPSILSVASCAALGLMVAVGSANAAATPPRLDAEWVAKWREDLEFARQRFPEAHANLYHSLPREAFDAALDSLSARLPNLSQVEVAVELARIVARVGDGHTRVTLPLADGIGFAQGHTGTDAPDAPGLVFRQLPIRLERFGDDLFVTSITAGHANLAGARVVRVAGMPAAEAMAAVAAIIHRDNVYGIDRWLARYMVLADLLYAVGVAPSPDRMTWTLATAEGRETTIELAAVAPGAAVDWVHARDVSREASPLWLARTDLYYWFEHLPESKTLYFQYNRVDDMESEALVDFVARMFGFIETHDVERLVIDLRHNDGGDNTLNRPLVHALICSRFQDRGSLYAIIGSQTFSAAMMFAISLERETPILFAGSPTGTTPNHYGDSRKVELPNSGLTVRLSTLYWQLSGPGDRREAIVPELPVTPTIADHRANRDPVLDQILTLHEVERTDLTGTWHGEFLPDPGVRYSVAVRFARDGSAWKASLDVAGTELQDVPMENVVLDGSRVAFDWMYGAVPLEIRGRLFEDRDGTTRFFADVRRSGRLSLMVLEAPAR